VSRARWGCSHGVGMLLAALYALAIPAMGAVVPAIDLGNAALGEAGARVPPNLLLNLALDESAAAAAYPGMADYARTRVYMGYFNPLGCYAYPSKAGVPDLSEADGHFSPLRAADALHECGGGAFSGNFLNWASASTLDIVRYALSGGDRVIDRAGVTVLQRAYLPDHFYLHPRYFPRKVLQAGAGSAPSQVTPFDTPTLYIVSCRNRILFGDGTAGNGCDAAAGTVTSDRRFGEFFARVDVCNAHEGPQRPDLCTAYGNAYKPAGVLQAYGSLIRTGLFSYLTEHGAGNPNQYGGVLRAPLAFIGQQRYEAPDFATAVANAGAEWSGISGILKVNPASAPTPLSGMINYVNRLGRGTPSHSGRYRVDAPLGELYYEALRYVQGRQPSAGAADADSDDGFPVLRRWTDPLLAACQRTVALTIGDSAAAEDRYVPGNSRDDYLDAARAEDVFGGLAPMNVMRWTRRVGDMERDASGAFGNRAPRPGLGGLELQNTGKDGRGTYYLAGLAYWAHTNPLRPRQSGRLGQTLDNDVIDLDVGGNGSVGDSGGRATAPPDRQLYLAAKYGGFLDDNSDGNPFITTGGVAGPIHSDGEWRGDGTSPAHYFLGSDPAALNAAVRAVFAAAGAPSGRVAGATAMALQTPREPAYLFQSEFIEPNWSGRLTRRALAVDAGGAIQAGAVLWEAGAMLSGDGGQDPARPASPAPALRKLYTANMLADGGSSVIPLAWQALSEAQRDALDRPPLAGNATEVSVRDGLGERRLAYLRGDRSLEGSLFRRRGGVLGDSINAAPVYVGKPSAAMTGTGYANFYDSHLARRAVVYLGANDGFLHAFDAASGGELFAYLPNALFDTVSALAEPSYRHRAYVDGGAAVGEASVAGQWKSVLVSGMGGGAQGVFALDVSDPDHFAVNGLIWEFTDKDDAGIGYVLAPPVLAKIKIASRTGVPEYRYFALVASGLNNYVDDGKSRFTAAGTGALFLLALDKPAVQPWKLGQNYYKLVTAISAPSMANGLGPPALVVDADGAVRYAYAGDLQGNLWRFDFTGMPPWSNAVGPGPDNAPLFVARDGGGRRQPITQQPNVVFAPGGGYLISFGTGQFFGRADAVPGTFQPQSFYTIRDNGTKAVVPGRVALASRSLDAAGEGPDGRFAVHGDPFDFLGPSAKAGWYLDFADTERSGERSISKAVLAAGKVFFNTVLPGSDPCAAAATRSYGLDVLTGLAFDEQGRPQSGLLTGLWSEQAMPGAPVVVDMSVATGQRDATGRALATRHYVVLNPGKPGSNLGTAAGATVLSKGVLAMPARRLSWREVANWRELHEGAMK